MRNGNASITRLNSYFFIRLPLEILNAWNGFYYNQIIYYQPRMDTNEHEFLGSPLNTRKKLNASQTSAIVLKRLLAEGEF